MGKEKSTSMKKEKLKRLLSAWLCLALILVSLMTPDMTVMAAGNSVKSITLNVKSKVTMYKGSTKTVKVTGVTPKTASKKVAFKSSAPGVVKISSKGVMKAVKAGKATITVTSSFNRRITKKINVTVKNIVKNAVEDKVVIPLDKKKTLKLSLAVKANTLSFSSSKKSVATIDSKGVIKAKKTGTAKITVKGKKGTAKNAKQAITVYVAKKSVKSVSLNTKKKVLTPGKTFTLKTKVNPSQAANVVSYKSSKTSVATVSSKGKVKALKAGTAKITATTIDGKKKAVCTVVVTKKMVEPSTTANPEETTKKEETTTVKPTEPAALGEPTDIKLNRSSITLEYGASVTLRATITPEEVKDPTVKWTSSNAKVATVTDGAILGVGEGDAVITAATVNGLKATCSVHVNAPAEQGTTSVAVESISFSKTEVTLGQGAYEGITVDVKPAAAVESVVLSSSDTYIATVTNQGLNKDGKIIAGIVGGFPGTVYITAVAGGKTATCTVTVEKKAQEPDYVVPYIATRYFDSTPTTEENVIIPYYISDNEQSEYVKNKSDVKMNLVYEVDNTVKKQTNVSLGENELNLGKLSEGEHVIGVQAEYPDTGKRSHRVYISVKVVNKDKKSYKVEETELTSENDTSTAKEMADKLNALFSEKVSKGYDIVVLPKDATYTIDGTDGGLKIPSGLTVDLNGSTIKMAVSKGSNAAIVTMDQVEDAHITGGTLQGDRGESGASGAVAIRIRGGNHCTADNLTIKNISGNAYVTERVESKFSRLIADNEFKRAFSENDKNFVITSTPMVDLTELKKENGDAADYVMIGCNDYKKTVRAVSGEIYIDFYDSNKKLIDTVEGYQHRKTKIPADAQYAQAKVLGGLEGEDRIRVYFNELGENLEVTNVQFENIAGTAIEPTTFNNLLVKGCTFTKVGGRAAHISEGEQNGAGGGWTEAQDLYYINNKVTDGYKDVYFNTGRNLYLQNLTGQNITFRDGVLGGTIRDMKDEGMTVNWTFGAAYLCGYGRIFDNSCKNINVKHLPTDRVFQPLPEFRIKNCTIVGDQFSSELDYVEYVNCTFTNFKGDLGVLRGCTLNSDAEIGDDVIIHSK